jgi:hypothetical protein
MQAYNIAGKYSDFINTQPWGPTSLLYNGSRVFPGGKELPGREADPSTSSSAVVMKE